MAGIGFELKKLFKKKSFLSSLRAYGYTTIICTGPMILGILLLLGITILCNFSGTPRGTTDIILSMITYTLLTSLIATSFLSMVSVRFVADMLYENRYETILSSFWGVVTLTIIPTGIIYRIFLFFSGATYLQQVFLIILFGLLIIVWNTMSYLTAIKDYKSIFLSFTAAITVTFLTGVLLLWLSVPVIEAMLVSVITGYGVMDLWNIILLYRYFPQSKTSPFLFLKWVDEFRALAITGLCANIGMFAHIVIMWFSSVGKNVYGLFYSAPFYDVPALIAFMTTLVTSVNFVVSVEVNFYPKYKNHYALYNSNGTIKDIKIAENEMLQTLKLELFYTSLKQLFATAIFLAVMGYFLNVLPLGFNELMRGYFRTLCIAYGLYAIANMLMLILLYFTDYKGALFATVSFSVTSIVFTIISLFFSQEQYGFGFLFSAFVYAVISVVRLEYFTKKLPYFILAVKPLVEETKYGMFSRLGKFLDKKLL